MAVEQDFCLFTGHSFSDLFAQDIKDARYVFFASYPSTAGWSHFPNTQHYLIQDGNAEERKVSYQFN